MSYFTQISYSDSGSVDAFQRVRMSSPETLFTVMSGYDTNPIKMENGATGTGVAPSWSSNTRMVTLSATAGSGTSYSQSYQYFPYEPGKALRHGTPVLAKEGWVNIEDIKVGDIIFDGNGELTEVEGVFPQGVRQLYRLTFDDKTEIDADGEHLWEIIIREGKKKGEKRILTTNQMLEEKGNYPKGVNRWRIKASPVLKIDRQDVLIDPYTMGAILGDGHIYPIGYVSITNNDREIIDNLVCNRISVFNKDGSNCYGLCGLTEHIRNYNLQGCNSFTKFVPYQYKYNSEEIRLAVLQGLMDTDGTCDYRTGNCEYMTVSCRLAEDVEFLVRSLGGQVRTRRKKTHYTDSNGNKIDCALAYRITIIMPVNPFRLKRKVDLWKPRTYISYDRYIHSIVPIDNDEATCIRVKSDCHTFITKGHVVTHNSQFIAITGVMGAATASAVKEFGYFDTANGIIFRQNGTSGLELVRRTSTGGSVSEEVVPQASWNVDKLNGTGASGITLNTSNTFILIIDLQFLGMGRVRIGFDINGILIIAHQFLNANNLTTPYMQTATLPVQALLTASSTATTATMYFKCAAVQSEGGFLESLGYAFSTPSVAATAAKDARASAISIRPKTTFNGVANRSMFILNGINIVTTQAQAVYWELAVGTTFSAGPTWADVNTTYSSFEYGYSSTYSGLTGLVLSSGYISNSGAKTAMELSTALRYPICLNRAGAVTSNGTLTLLVTGIGASCTLQCGFDFTEIR